MSTFNQTDTNTTHGVVAMCSGSTTSTAYGDTQISTSDAAGTGYETITLVKGTTAIGCAFESKSGQPGITAWAAGTYTVNINVTTANADVFWEHTYVCRCNSSGVNQETIGSTTSQHTSCGTTGTKSMSVTGAATTASATDRLYIVCVFQNTKSTASRTIGYQNSLTVVTPLGNQTATIAAAEALTAAVQAPTVVIGQTVLPDALALTGTLQAPSVTLSSSVSPDALALTGTLQAPTVTVGVSERVRYVNTGSAGGDGTTNELSGTHAAYATLQAALTGEAANLVTDNVYLTIYCEGTTEDEGGSTSIAADVTGFTTNETHTITIKTTAANRHAGKWSETKYRLHAGIVGIKIQNSFVTLDGLQIFAGHRADDNSLHAVSILTAVSTITVKNCLIKLDLANVVTYGTGSYAINCATDATTPRYLWNNIIYDYAKTTNAGIYSPYNTGHTYAYHNTIENCTTGIIAGFEHLIAKNNLVTNCTTGFSGDFDSSSNYNVTTSSTAPGGNSKTSQTITYADADNDDFHTTDTDVQVANCLYADAAIAVTTDIDGVARPSSGNVCAGADEAGGDQTANPDALTLTGTAQAPSVTLSSSVTATVLELTAAAPAPAVTRTESASPVALELTATLPAPGVTLSSSVSPAALELTAAQLAPGISRTETAQPVALELTASVEAPAVTLSSSVSPAALELAGTVQAPAVTRTESASPAALELTAVLPAPAAAYDYALSVAALELALAAPAPLAGAGIAVSPASVDLSIAVEAPAVTLSSSVTPAAVELALAAPAPGVSRTESAQPAALELTAAAQAPAVTRSESAQPGELALVLAAPAPSISAGASSSVFPDALALSGSVQAPAVSRSESAQPAALELTAAAPAPAVSIGASISVFPAALSLAAELAAPLTTYDCAQVVAALSLAATLPTSSVALSMSVSPAAVALVATLPAAVAVTAQTVEPAALELTATLPAITFTGDAEIAPAALALVVALPAAEMGGVGYDEMTRELVAVEVSGADYRAAVDDGAVAAAMVQGTKYKAILS